MRAALHHGWDEAGQWVKATRVHGSAMQPAARILLAALGAPSGEPELGSSRAGATSLARAPAARAQGAAAQDDLSWALAGPVTWACPFF